MEQTFKIFKALSDKTRLSIAVFLAKNQETACSKFSESFKLSQPTLSHHFSKLLEAGVILERKEGVSHFYRINHELLKKAGVDLKNIKLS